MSCVTCEPKSKIKMDSCMLEYFGANLINLSFHSRFFLKLAIKIFDMAATKKGKKPSKPKSGSKPKKKSKKNNSGNIFAKLLLFVIIISALTYVVSVFLKNDNVKIKRVDNTEAVVEKQDTPSTDKKQDKTEPKKEVNKPEVKKEEVKTVVDKENEVEVGVNVNVDVNVKPEVIDLKKEFKENQTLSGCWLSNMQGASLTIDEYGYRIDFFGVDASKPMTGTYVIDGNHIIFKSNDDVCKNEEGSYRITFNKKDFSLNCKNDDCKKRRNILESDWEWIEIE